jgi:hypothetical protein
MSLKHMYPAPAADVPGSTKVQPSHWNDEHVFADGALGDVLQRDPGDATTGWSWLSGVALDATVMKKPRYRSAAWMNFAPGNTTPTLVGLAGLVTAGTMADASDADHVYTNFSIATLNSIIGMTIGGASLFYQGRHDPSLYVLLKTGASIANLRLFVGFSSTDVPVTADGSVAGDYCGVRFSTSAGNTGWVGITCNNAVQTTTAQIGANVAANTVYAIEVALSGDGTLVTLTVNGVSVTTAVTLPTPSVGMKPDARARNLLAESKSISLAKFYWEWD